MKYLLIGTGLLITAFSAFGAKKVMDYSQVIDKLQIAITHISNLDISFTRIKFDVKLRLINPTNVSLDFTTVGLIDFKTLMIYDAAGKLLATVQVNKNNISIPANGEWRSLWLPVQLPLNNVLNQLLDTTGVDMSQFSYKAVINVAGLGDYTIG